MISRNLSYVTKGRMIIHKPQKNEYAEYTTTVSIMMRIYAFCIHSRNTQIPKLYMPNDEATIFGEH